MPITAYENVGGCKQLAVDSGRWSRSVYRRRRGKRLKCSAKGRKKNVGRRFRDVEKLPREAEGCAKDHLSSREANPLLWRGPEAEEDPGKMLIPEAVHTAGSESVLQRTMEPFHHPIALWMISRGLMMHNAEDGTQAVPESRNKLGTTVGGQMSWNAKSGDPMCNQGVSTN